MTTVFNRKSGKLDEEKTPWKGGLLFLYGNNPLRFLIRPLLCRFSLASKLFGWLQNRSSSKKNIAPFIEKYQIDPSEFLNTPSTFASFNDFFIRKLKPSARPICKEEGRAILPADGRYLAFRDIEHEEGFWVKGKKFSLETLLQDKMLAHKYAQGAMVMARLAPVDYHRFHFPCDCIPSEAKLINGALYSVNPLALRQNIDILTENKRVITCLKTSRFGTVLFIEVGATYVGSIIQTHRANQAQMKGAEKGYFSFGGSCLLLIFEPFRIQLDEDLLENTHKGIETLGQMGQSLGKAHVS